MTKLSKFDMQKATRLTREGRLKEAMAVLRGALQGSRSSASGDAAEGVQPGAGTPSLIDMVPPSKVTGSAWSAPISGHESAPPHSKQTSGFNHVIDGIRQYGLSTGLEGLLGRSGKSSPVPPPAPGAFEERSYSNAAGQRNYKLYVPSGYTGQAVPLVIMLHGCTQSPDDFAAGTRMNELAEEQVFLVAYPQQSKSANAAGCWNWFSAADQMRDHGEPSLIAGITRQIIRDFAVAPGRVYVAGLSAGGAAAAIMGAAYPDLYAAVGIHSGLPCGAARDMASALAAMQHGSGAIATLKAGTRTVPTIVFHGDRDKTVNPVNADQIVAQAGAAGLVATVSQGKSAAGLGYTRTLMRDAAGQTVLEQWVLHGAGHAWSGGSAAGSYTEPRGPDASREMLRFFLQHRVGGGEQ